MPSTDHELMHACGRGSAAAFDELVRRWQQRVAGIVVRLANSADVDDLCQEVFLRVYLARASYRPAAAFSTWLYRIAVNVARDFQRRNRRVVERLNLIDPAKVTEPADVEAIQAEEARRVQLAVSQLPERLREAVALKHFGELTFAELAEVLDIPLSTAKSRVEAGLIELHALLSVPRQQSKECHHELRSNPSAAH